MNHDDTTQQFALRPLPPPRPAAYAPQVQLALAAIVGKVLAWEARGTQEERAKRLHNLYQYLSGRVEGCHNPLGGLRQYRQFGDLAQDAAEILRLGGAA